MVVILNRTVVGRNRTDRVDTMIISATELKRNLGHWMDVSATEDVYVERKGRLVTKLSNPYGDLVEVAESLVGILPTDLDAEALLSERLDAI